MHPEKLQHLRFPGTPGRQGEAFGESCRELIAEALGRWRRSVAVDGLDPSLWAATLSGQAGYLLAIERLAPRFLAFMRGAARGAGQPFREVLASNMMDEDWLLRPRAIPRGTATREPLEACTVLGGPTVDGFAGGQNMDIQPWVEGLQVIVELETSEACGNLLFASAAQVPTCGMSTQGIGMLLNTVSQLRSNLEGLPICALQFELLHQPNRRAAVNFLRSVPHASGQAFTVTDATGVTCLECGADGVVEVPPDPSTGVVVHTNHPLVEQRLRTPDDAIEIENLDVQGSTQSRLAQARNRLAGHPRLTVELVQHALRSRDDPERPVSREGSNAHGKPLGYTSFSVVYEYRNGAPAALHVAPGPPSVTEYRRIALD